MKKDQRSQNHHYVPKCYLKNFSADGKVSVLDVRKVINGIPHYVKALSPKAICTFEDYYKIPATASDSSNIYFQLNSLDELFVESTVLHNLEDKYGKILYPSLISKTEITMQEAIDISDFIIQLKLRNPYWFEQQQKKKDDMIDKAINNIYQDNFVLNPRFANIPTSIKEIVADHVKQGAINNPNFSKMMQLFSLINRASSNEKRNQEIRQSIIDCEWKLLTAPKNGLKFITSDNPGFAIGNDNLIYNTKFTEGFLFYFPVSPKHCLAISDANLDLSFSKGQTEKSIKHLNIDDKMVLHINDRAIQKINKLLIASDDWYLNQIRDLNTPSKK